MVVTEGQRLNTVGMRDIGSKASVLLSMASLVVNPATLCGGGVTSGAVKDEWFYRVFGGRPFVWSALVLGVAMTKVSVCTGENLVKHHPKCDSVSLGVAACFDLSIIDRFRQDETDR
jgi:hypothetical protein